MKQFLISILLILFSLIFFKQLRALFGPPEIGSKSLVGFAQYFGYPFYFDTALFLFIILVPFIVFYFFQRKQRND